MKFSIFKIKDDDDNMLKSFKNILDCGELEIDPEKNIFFVETSSVQNKSSKISSLKLRQACCVESAALMNPNSRIFVVFLSGFGLSNSSTMEVLKKLKNVYFVHLNLLEFTKNTPVENWMREGKIYQTNYLKSNVANILKVLLLWRLEKSIGNQITTKNLLKSIFSRYGGTYFDFDVFSNVSLQTIQKSNFLISENKNLTLYYTL